jgi:RNA polymerase sigma-70 factor (ECF subfamily)
MTEFSCNDVIILTLILMREKIEKEDMLDNEREIVERAKEDDQAFEVLYDFYFPKIYGYILKRVGDSGTAEDLVSKTFLNVFTNLKNYQYKGYSFGAWVYRIAANNLIDYYRKSGKRKEINIEEVKELQDDTNDTLDELIQHTQERKLVQETLRVLPEKYQEVLDLKFFAERTTDEIAGILETNENNVRVLLFRALKLFKEEYKKYEK